jgi:hypothetical protein
MQGQSYVFKVQAFAPENPVPLWTFTPKDMQGLQIAFAVAVDKLRQDLRRGHRRGQLPGVRLHRLVAPWREAASAPGQPGTNTAHAVSTRPVASSNAGP